MFGTYRLILALMVVALHIGGVPLIGAYAVFGFYALSGYLMTYIMHRNYGFTVQGVCKYALNRFLRIYPMYWISIAFSAGLVFAVGESYSSQYHEDIFYPHTLVELLRNIFLFFPGRESPRLTPPAWALTVEIFFYICIGLGLSINKRVVVGWLVASVLYHVIIIVAQLGWEPRYFTIAAASLPFATGALIYHYGREAVDFISRVIPILMHRYSPLALLLLLLVNWLLGYMLGGAKSVFFYTSYVITALEVVLLAQAKELPFISKKFDKFMGDLSYPLYLIHYQVALIVMVSLQKMGYAINRPDLVLLFVSTPFILLLSWIFAITLEAPIELVRERVKHYSRLS